MKKASPSRWLWVGNLLLIVALLLSFLRMRTLIPESGLVIGLTFTLAIASILCFTWYLIQLSRSKS